MADVPSIVQMLTSAASSSASAAVSSVASAVSAASSAASSTSVMVTGIATASVIVAALLFLTLLGRELTVSFGNDRFDVDAFNIALVPLAIAFAVNLGIHAMVVLNVL